MNGRRSRSLSPPSLIQCMYLEDIRSSNVVVETLARSRNRPLLYFMVFRDNVLAGRFCWRRGLPYGPYAYTGPHCLPRAWSLRRSPRPHRPGRYFIPALKRAPAEISFRNSLRSRARCRGPVASPRRNIAEPKDKLYRPATLA